METCLQNLLSKTAPLPWIITLAVTISFAGARFLLLSAQARTGQHPFAAILSCSDSRATPEIIFDRGLGDLFIVRDAGNVPNAVVLESLHYAVAHLGSRIILVLGHSNYGAVTATLAGHTGDVPEIAKLIRPQSKSPKASRAMRWTTRSERTCD